MTTATLLHPGYVRGDHVGSSVGLVVDGDARLVVDPGMVADRALILEPLAALGIRTRDVTHVVLTHHHPDHTINVGLFPDAEVVDFWARYVGDRWLDHDGDGWRPSPRTRLLLTPGHTEEDLTLAAETDEGTWAFTHCWWHEDRTPEVDPLAWDQAALERSRERILEIADVVVPAHGSPFRVR
jgi:glyoxylase-like metal-dependent hydrolase (beta-lactamase superfamily II)